MQSHGVAISFCIPAFPAGIFAYAPSFAILLFTRGPPFPARPSPCTRRRWSWTRGEGRARRRRSSDLLPWLVLPDGAFFSLCGPERRRGARVCRRGHRRPLCHAHRRGQLHRRAGGGLGQVRRQGPMRRAGETTQGTSTTGGAVPVGVRWLASMVHRAVMADGTTKFAIFRANLGSSRWSEVRSVCDCDCDDTAYERDGTGGR